MFLFGSLEELLQAAFLVGGVLFLRGFYLLSRAYLVKVYIGKGVEQLISFFSLANYLLEFR